MQSLQSLQSINSIAALEDVPSRRKKLYKERVDPFLKGDEEFKKRYRVTKTVANALINLVQDDLQLSRNGGSISPELQVLTALRCWGHCEVQEDSGDHHGLSQPTVSRICNRVARALARHSVEIIQMPSSFAHRKTMREYTEIQNFLQSLAASIVPI